MRFGNEVAIGDSEQVDYEKDSLIWNCKYWWIDDPDWPW